MKKLLALIVIMLAFTIPTMGKAQEGYYFGALGGVNFMDSHFLNQRHCKFDAGCNFGIVGGYAWCAGWRLETEVSYYHNQYNLHGTDVDALETTYHGNVHLWSAMINGYYEIPDWECWCITPYVGAGIGVDNVHQSIKICKEKSTGSCTGFAWQLMAGLNYLVFDEVVLSAGYKFHVAPLRHGHHLQNHSIILGINVMTCCLFD